MQVPKPASFLAFALLCGAAVADEEGPAGWLPCTSDDQRCTSTQTISLGKVREKPALTSTPACGDEAPTTNKLLERVLNQPETSSESLIASGAVPGCQALTGNGNGAKVVGMNCAASPRLSLCAFYAIVCCNLVHTPPLGDTET